MRRGRLSEAHSGASGSVKPACHDIDGLVARARQKQTAINYMQIPESLQMAVRRHRACVLQVVSPIHSRSVCWRPRKRPRGMPDALQRHGKRHWRIFRAADALLKIADAAATVTSSLLLAFSQEGPEGSGLVVEHGGAVGPPPAGPGGNAVWSASVRCSTVALVRHPSAQ